MGLTSSVQEAPVDRSIGFHEQVHDFFFIKPFNDSIRFSAFGIDENACFAFLLDGFLFMITNNLHGYSLSFPQPRRSHRNVLHPSRITPFLVLFQNALW